MLDLMIYVIEKLLRYSGFNRYCGFNIYLYSLVDFVEYEFVCWNNLL